jgi:hypothetical protein
MKHFGILSSLTAVSMAATSYTSTFSTLDVAGSVIHDSQESVVPGGEVEYKVWLGTVKKDFRSIQLTSEEYAIESCNMYM